MLVDLIPPKVPVRPKPDPEGPYAGYELIAPLRAEAMREALERMRYGRSV